jgi:superfamily I DNA/RNA helicase
VASSGAGRERRGSAREGAWAFARRSGREARRLAAAASGGADDADAAVRAALRDAGFAARPRPAGDALLSGAHAVLDLEAASIWYRADATPADRLVYLAHELGHLNLHYLGRDTGGCSCDAQDLDDDPLLLGSVGYGPRQRRETEANVWAREFLLPVPVVRRLFADSALTAPEIARRCALPLPLVYHQLVESLSADAADDAAPAHETAADTAVRPSPFPLDPSQATAARAEAGPLLVGAGPGTGKTRTLTERLLFLVQEQGVAPEQILALTFSRKATAEMAERLAARDPVTARRIAVSTFHAFGLDLLRRHWSAAGLPPRPVLLEQADALALLERRLHMVRLGPLRYLHDPAYPLPDTLQIIGRAKEQAIDPGGFAARAEAANDDRLRDAARMYRLYEELLGEKGAIDFADLVARPLRLLETDPHVRAAEQARWRHILVDEYQDVNRAGARLVRVLSGGDGEGTGLWAVGDLRQAIYAFRGASPGNVTRFREDFPGGRRTELAVNYRSVPELVALFGVACGEGRDTWRAARESAAGDSAGGEHTPAPSAAARLAVAGDDVAQADGIAREIRRFADAGYGFGDQVVLCRTHGQGRAIRAALVDRGLPVTADAAGETVLAYLDVRELLVLLARVVDPAGPSRHRFPELPASLRVSISNPGADALDLFREALWGEQGMARRLAAPEAVAVLLALAQTFRERASVILDEDEEPRRAFLAHLRRLLRLGSLPSVASRAVGAEDAPPAADAVRVLTVHAAKGLEFPVVFVPNLSAGKFPSRPAPSLLPALPDAAGASAPADDEEARLFFVAMTRARDHLILSRAERYNGRAAAPSPLLACVERDAADGLLQQSTWDRESAPTASIAVATGEVVLDGDAAPRPAVPAPDAEIYLRCPRRYYYARVLDLPPGDADAYTMFRRAVNLSLESPDPVAALDAAWVERGPAHWHPHARLYRAAADEIVAGAAANPDLASANRRRAATATSPPQQALTLALEHGDVLVHAGLLDPGTPVFEQATYRRAPAADTPVDPEPRISLLQEAAAAAGTPTMPVVRMRYVQSGETRAVADKPKMRQKHLAAYDRAIRGIRLKLWPPAPEEGTDCAACPYLFVCPD